MSKPTQIIVPGMGSNHCAGLIAASVRRLPGIIELNTNIANHKVTVRFDPATVDAERIKVAIEKAGYEVAGVS